MKTKPSKANLFKLLYRQKVIENSICANCPFLNSQDTNDCKGCESYKELNNIGLWMLKDTSERRGRSVVVVEVQETTKKQMAVDKLTVEGYRIYQSFNLNDVDIADKLNVTYASFHEWKRDMGLVKRKGARV